MHHIITNCKLVKVDLPPRHPRRVQGLGVIVVRAGQSSLLGAGPGIIFSESFEKYYWPEQEVAVQISCRASIGFVGSELRIEREGAVDS